MTIKLRIKANNIYNPALEGVVVESEFYPATTNTKAVYKVPGSQLLQYDEGFSNEEFLFAFLPEHVTVLEDDTQQSTATQGVTRIRILESNSYNPKLAGTVIDAVFCPETITTNEAYAVTASALHLFDPKFDKDTDVYHFLAKYVEVVSDDTPLTVPEERAPIAPPVETKVRVRILPECDYPSTAIKGLVFDAVHSTETEVFFEVYAVPWEELNKYDDKFTADGAADGGAYYFSSDDVEVVV